MRFLSFIIVLFFITTSQAQDITTWTKLGSANWSTSKGITQATSGNGFLLSPDSYKDFTITLDFWVDTEANSGVFIRCTNPEMVDRVNAYEVTIWDKRPDQKYRTGAIVDVSQPLTMINTGNKWNTYEITAKGNHFIVKLNDKVTVDIDDSKHPTGRIALQYAAGVVKFRKVKIKTL
jgi:hypothetical protein